MVIVVLCYRRLDWTVVKKSIWSTILTTGMVFLIIAGATAFGQILAFSGATNGLSKFSVNLSLPLC